MALSNQTPEQAARDKIDEMLSQSGWVVQDRKKIEFRAGPGVAVREYQTDVGPADYVLFVDKKPVGVIEAKPEDWGRKITTVEEQSAAYAAAKLKWVNNKEPLPFVYESTGVITRFTDGRDPKPRSREVFSFPRPETVKDWHAQPASLRERLQWLPDLDPTGLRACQVNAIEKLEASFKDDRPRAVIQMATGSGKTYTAITSIYRLLKHSDAKRVLFLVDTRNLGEQAEQEFMAYVPSDDNRKFTELYNVQRLRSSFVARDSQVCISTIQRMYSILKGEELDESCEEINPAEMVQHRQPVPVVYNGKIPPEFFDFIVIDECHRSIYNLWRQVLEYFDAYLIGLTATPDNRTYGFFKTNIVSEYDHEQAVADGVNVGNEIYVIDTEKTRHGGQIKANQQIEKRERLTRFRRWAPEQLLARIKQGRAARYEAQLAEWESALKEWETEGKARKKPSRPKVPMEPTAEGTSNLPEGWLSVKVGSLLTEPPSNGRSVKDRSNGLPVLRLTALKNAKLDLSEVKNGDWERQDALPYLVRAGDFFVSRGNGSKQLVGRGGVAVTVVGDVAYPDTMIRLRVDPSMVNRSFLSYVWNSRLLRREIEGVARTTAGIYKINQGHIVNFVLPLCSLSEQSVLVGGLSAVWSLIDRIEGAVNDSIGAVDGLRQAILKKAFSGQLVRQDPNDEPASVLLERIKTDKRLHSKGARGGKRPARQKDTGRATV